MISALSLHLRLTGLLTLLLAVLVGIAVVYAELRSQEVARRDVDRRLRIGARLILSFSGMPTPDTSAALAGVDASAADAEADGRAITPSIELRGIDGRLVYRSVDFPADMQQTEEGFSDRRSNGDEWRVLTARDVDLGLTGRAAIRDEDTERLAHTIRSDILVPTIALLVMLAITVLGAIWLGLRPLRRIEREIGGLDASRTGPLKLDPSTMPREFSRLTRTLNDLLDRLRRLLRHQQAFVSAAGHELRTPLAGCSTQLEIARRSADPAQRDHALARLDQGLRRMRGLVEQLLVIARSERSSLDAAGKIFDLHDLACEVVDGLGPGGDRVDIVVASPPLRMDGHPDLVASMIANLVENAMRVSPPDERVKLRLTRRGGDIGIAVCDCGPGLTEDQKARVFESFYSGADGAGAGTGLGLAIVQAVALAHRGAVTATDRKSGGLCMEVTLPSVRPAS